MLAIAIVALVLSIISLFLLIGEGVVLARLTDEFKNMKE